MKIKHTRTQKGDVISPRKRAIAIKKTYHDQLQAAFNLIESAGFYCISIKFKPLFIAYSKTNAKGKKVILKMAQQMMLKEPYYNADGSKSE